MLVNPSGLPGHTMRIDLNIEHLIQYLKVNCFFIFAAYMSWQDSVTLCCQRNLFELGPTWEHCSWYQLYTAGKEEVTKSLKSGYQGSTHMDVDTSALTVYGRLLTKLMNLTFNTPSLMLRTQQRCSVARLERLPQHWIESELQPVWCRRRRQPLDRALVQELDNTQHWTANS